jgi:hypothetical protein
MLPGKHFNVYMIVDIVVPPSVIRQETMKLHLIPHSPCSLSPFILMKQKSATKIVARVAFAPQFSIP